jgi:hypothetical protein
MRRANHEGVGDGGRVDALHQQLLNLRQETARHNNNRGRAITSLNILRLRQLDKLETHTGEWRYTESQTSVENTNHLAGGVLNVHLLQDGGTVVGDCDVTSRCDDLHHPRKNTLGMRH